MTFGTAVVPTNFVPFKNVTINPDVSLFFPPVMMGQRDLNIFPLYGEYRFSGSVDGPLYPINGIPLFVGAIGVDGGNAKVSTNAAGSGQGVVGTATGTKIGTMAPTVAGATTVTYTITSGAAPAALDYFQFGSDQNAEVRQVSAVTGTGPYTLTVAALTNAHAANVYGTNPTCINVLKNGTFGALAQGATTGTYTLVAGAAPVTGDIFTFDINVAGTPTTTETRKASTVTGAGPYTITFDVATTFSHGAGITAYAVTTPYTHTIQQINLLDSFTIEKNVGGFQSEQYAGCRINKYSLKLAAGNTEAEISADVFAQSQVVLSTPSTVTTDASAPFIFAEASMALFGTTVNHFSAIDLQIENGVKPIYTFNSANTPQFVPAITRKITGKLTAVFGSLNDTQIGYFTKTVNKVQTSLSFSLVHPAGLGSVFITLPQVNLAKYQDDIKIGDVVFNTLDFQASYQLSGNPAQTITAIVVSNNYLGI